MKAPKTTELECEKCGGVCCKYHLNTFKRNNFIAQEYYKQRAEKIIKFDDKHDTAIMYQPCPLFNEKTGLCKDYKNRNSTCKDFPPQYVPAWAPLCELMRNNFSKKRTGKYRVLKI